MMADNSGSGIGHSNMEHNQIVQQLSARLISLTVEGIDYVVSVTTIDRDSIHFIEGNPDNGVLPPNQYTLDSITLKLFKEGRATSISATHINDASDLDRLLEQAKGMMLPSNEVPMEPQQYPKLNLYDEETARLSRQDLVDVGKRINAILADERLKDQTMIIAVRKNIASTTVFSSKGLRETYDETYFNVSVSSRKLDYDKSFHARAFKEFDLESYAKKVRDFALGSLQKAEGFEEGTYTAVFAPEVFEEMITNFLLYSHDAKNVVDGSSRFNREDQGKPSYSERLTVYADGALDMGVESAPFDSEGTPTGRRFLVKDGIIGFWGHKKYTGQLGLESLGEADGVRNLRVEPEKASPSYDAMLSQQGKVVLITSLYPMHTKKSASQGEMNLSATGLLYEN